MGTFVATSPLDQAIVGQGYRAEIGVLSEGDSWYFPPGSLMPPGLAFTEGVVHGVPTIPGTYTFFIHINSADGSRIYNEYILEVSGSRGVTESEIAALVAQAFQIGRLSTEQKWWVDEVIDPITGQSGLGFMVDDNGQTRTLGRILR